MMRDGDDERWRCVEINVSHQLRFTRAELAVCTDRDTWCAELSITTPTPPSSVWHFPTF
jgi:hypothetical protein